MTITSATLRKLATLNLDADQMAGVLELLAEQQEAEELRLVGQRERKARQRAGQSRDSHVTGSGQGEDTPSSPEVFPQTPFPNPSNPKTPSPPKGGSVPVGFDRFWALFPNKVGKADALKAFAKASQRVDLETMLAGLDRYVGKTDDRPWCNPSTWLNQDRWTDQPASQPRGSPPQRPRGMQGIFGEMSEVLANGHADDGGGHEPSGATVLSLPYRRSS